MINSTLVYKNTLKDYFNYSDFYIAITQIKYSSKAFFGVMMLNLSILILLVSTFIIINNSFESAVLFRKFYKTKRFQYQNVFNILQKGFVNTV